MNEELQYIIYRYVGDQKQYWCWETGWNLSTASIFDEEEKETFLREEEGSAATTI